ncbi:MAG: AMP-dependent synthetase [Alphaproteobacteria bacterium TMED199]|nr:MAG: AMP-dependent synthetase [Alphaproteobacteria bacterium TMED199]
MLKKLNNFEELSLTFKWNIPEFYNIASDTVDQDNYQNRIALINFLQDGKIEEWSFIDIKRSANKLANVFDHFHLEANARVGIILGQCPETAVAHMACFKSGKISIPLFNLFGTEALHYRLLNSRASLVICDNIGLNKIFEIKDRLPDLKKIICIDSNDEKSNVFNFKKLLEQASDSYITKKTKSSDPALIIYTSGTTGGPKGALLPHRTLLGHIPGVEIPHEFLSSSEPVTDLFWTPADWAWIGGLFDVLLPAWHFGIPVVSYRSQKFDPEVTFDLISKLEIKNTFLPPTALKMMKSFNPNKTIKNLKLRTVGSGGEALGEDLLEWGKQILGVGINEFYGQTECNLTVSNCGAIMPTKQGSIGKPVPGHEVRIINENGELIKEPGLDGEIIVKSDTPVSFLKYWENDKATKQKVKDGWLYTGDFAYKDEEGYFYFKGREDDIINTSGYRVGPSEVEDAVISHPKVSMVAVIGIPDKLRGQVIKAFVVPMDHKNVLNQNEILKKSIQNHVKLKLAAHEYPRIIEFVYELPLTTTGKIIRKDLRENN